MDERPPREPASDTTTATWLQGGGEMGELIRSYDWTHPWRTIPSRPRMFVVALTGYGQESDRKRSSEAGFDLHLMKPVEPGRLRELLTEEIRPVSDKAVEKTR